MLHMWHMEFLLFFIHRRFQSALFWADSPTNGQEQRENNTENVCKSRQFIKTHIISLLFLKEGVPCCLGYQSLALHSSNIRPKETNCPMEEPEIIEFPFQPRYFTYPGLWFYNEYNLFWYTSFRSRALLIQTIQVGGVGSLISVTLPQPPVLV